MARLSKASVSKIAIERTLRLVTITIHTARPGIIIGKGGQEVETLKEEVKKITNKEIQINIFEVKRPELEATLVAVITIPSSDVTFIFAVPDPALFEVMSRVLFTEEFTL